MYDCRNCSDCFGCVNLRGQKYSIFNVPYSREEYKQKIQELNSAIVNFETRILNLGKLNAKQFD